VCVSSRCQADMQDDLESSGPEVARALKAAYEDRDLYKSTGDKNGEASALYQAADLHAASGDYEDAIVMGMAAEALFRDVGNDEERAAVLRTVTQFHLGNGESKSALEVAEDALVLSKAVGNVEGEAEMLLMIARVNMELLEGSFKDSSLAESPIPMKVMAVVRKAADVARILEDKKMESDALCILSQASMAAREYQSAGTAASQAAAIYRDDGEYYDEAHAWLMAANAYIAAQNTDQAWEVASMALLLFREIEDEEGQALSEKAIDEIDAIKPIESVTDTKKAPKLAKAETPTAAEAEAETAEKPVASQASEKPAAVPKPPAPKRPIVRSIMQMMEDKMRWAVEDFNSCDDTPLMTTSFNWLPKAPVQNDLAVSVPMPEVWELQAWSEQHAPEARKKAAVVPGAAAVAGPLALTSQQSKEVEQQAASAALNGRVRTIVEDLVGMDDIAGDNPLMTVGLTSQSAVILREALSKEFPGPSLPFTMMFDYPSINGLTDFLSTRIK